KSRPDFLSPQATAENSKPRGSGDASMRSFMRPEMTSRHQLVSATRCVRRCPWRSPPPDGTAALSGTRSSLAQFFQAARAATRCQSPGARRIPVHASRQTPALFFAGVPPSAHIEPAAHPIRAREFLDALPATGSPLIQYRNFLATRTPQSGLFLPRPEILVYGRVHFLPCAAAVALRQRSARSTRESQPHLSVEPAASSRLFLLCTDPRLGFGKGFANGIWRRTSRRSPPRERRIERQRFGKVRLE